MNCSLCCSSFAIESCFVGTQTSVTDVAEQAVQDAKAMSTDVRLQVCLDDKMPYCCMCLLLGSLCTEFVLVTLDIRSKSRKSDCVLQDMYANVNESITSSLLSLAQRMHKLRLDPPHPQSIAQRGTPTPSSSSAPPATSEPQQTHSTDGHLGHDHTGSDAASIVAMEIGRAQAAAQEESAPFEASRWLSGRDKVTDKASRDEALRSLEPLEVTEGDQLTAESFRAALQPHLGFQLSIHKSGIEHEHAGDGVWLEGAADMGQVVAVHPGVVYSQAFHTCASLTLLHTYRLAARLSTSLTRCI